jgi:hypothetical protein
MALSISDPSKAKRRKEKSQALDHHISKKK